MNDSILKSWLQSDASIDRIRAARSLAKKSHPECLPELRTALLREKIPWVKSALQAAINKAENVEIVSATFVEDLEPLPVEDIQSQAINESIGQVLHELEPAIGRLRVVATEEIVDFQSSQVSMELRKIEGLMSTFENWRTVEQRPTPRNCNIGEILKEVVAEAIFGSCSENQIHLIDTGLLAFTTDPNVLRIVVSNAIRNAIEANSLVSNHLPVTVSYGRSDRGIWVSVVDQGSGLSVSRQVATKSQASTKPGHRGMGLAIVDRGVRALRGSWDLRNGSHGGAEFFLELPSPVR